MTRRSLTFFAVLALLCALLLVGPGVGSGSALGQPEPATETAPEPTAGPPPADDGAAACDPGELERAAGTHSNGVVPFSVIASGAMGDRRDAGVEVVSDRTGWEELRARGLVDEKLDAPDFSESAVLVVHAGRRPTAGYAVTVNRIRLLPEDPQTDARELLVEAAVEGPPEGSMAATVVTAPYVVISVPAEAVEHENITIDLQLL